MDQSGLRVGVSVLLVVLWFQQLGEVSFQLQLLDWMLVQSHQPVWLQIALEDSHGAEEKTGHQLLKVPCLSQLLKLVAA